MIKAEQTIAATTGNTNFFNSPPPPLKSLSGNLPNYEDSGKSRSLNSMNDQAGNEQTLDNFAQVMKRDWNQRARDNARWFINTVKLDQSEDEFDATGANEIGALIAPE